MIQITLKMWHRSVVALAFDIAYLHRELNLLGEKAMSRREYFFSDFGVPKPRPCTALAWASLCAFGPIQGYRKLTPIHDGELTEGPHGSIVKNYLESYRPWNPCMGAFLIPFLPSLSPNDDQSVGLPNASTLHVKSLDNQQQCGFAYIADAATGALGWQLPVGNGINVKQFSDMDMLNLHSHGYMWDSLLTSGSNHVDIPALHSYFEKDVNGCLYQFGLIQRIEGQSHDARFAMEQLAKNGIPYTEYLNPYMQVRKLLIRFLNIEAVHAWAQAYAMSMTHIFNDISIQEDEELLLVQAAEMRERKAKDEIKTLSKSTRRQRLRDKLDLKSGLAGMFDMESNDS